LICWFAVSTLLGAKNRGFFRIMTLNINTRGELKKKQYFTMKLE
jgi:hypothetical protein